MNSEIVERPDNPRILVVDDEPFVLTVLERLLRESDFFVGSARNGAEALRVFAEGAWDLVITDRAMPEMNGEDLADCIKKAAPETPVILITGYGRPGNNGDLFDAVLSKPFSKEELLATVGRALRSKAGVLREVY